MAQSRWLPVDDVEAVREMTCRTEPCPICSAAVGETCTYRTEGVVSGHLGNPFSHTGRYELLARQGLLPTLGKEVD